jgi:hypothetical protein
MDLSGHRIAARAGMVAFLLLGSFSVFALGQGAYRFEKFAIDPEGQTVPQAGIAKDPFNCKHLEQIRCVDKMNSAAWNGLDAGAWINAAYADLPSTGGDIYVVAGNYSFSTPILFGTANKPARIVGAPASGTTLTYTRTSGTAFTYNVGAGHQWGGGLENITLAGPGAETNTTGILLGGNHGAEGVVRRNVKVTGFGTAEAYSHNAFLTECEHCVYIGNGVPALNIPSGLTNTGESLSYIDSAIANSPGNTSGCVAISAPVNNLSFVGGSFDNCQFTMSSGQVHLSRVHFENPAETSTVPFVSVTGGRLSLIDPDIQWNGSANLPSPSAAIACSAGALIMNGASFFAGSTPIIAANVNLSGTCEFHESGTKLSSGFSTFLSNSSSGPVSTYGNVWGNNQLLNSGSLQLAGVDFLLGPAPPGNPYTIHAVGPAAARTLSINDPGGDANLLLAVGGSTSLNGSAALTFTSIAAQTCQEQNVTVAGAIRGKGAFFSPGTSLGSTNLSWSSWVSATDTVSVRVCNPTTGEITPSTVTWNGWVQQ